MNEAKGRREDEPSVQVASSASDPDDSMLTTRLPAITPPPPFTKYSSAPPASQAPSSVPPRGSFGDSYQDVAIPPLPRTSWWKALLTATVPPPASIPVMPADENVIRRRIGATCAGMAVGFVVLALVLGLRGADTTSVPVVSAAHIIARALIALGFLAFGNSLLRMSERFLSGGRSNGDSSRNASTPNLN